MVRTDIATWDCVVYGGGAAVDVGGRRGLGAAARRRARFFAHQHDAPHCERQPVGSVVGVLHAACRVIVQKGDQGCG